MTRPERTRSALETNLTRWGGWDSTAGEERGGELQGKDFLGVVARSQGAYLGPLELDVLSWLTARWYEQGRHPEGLVRCTLYELGVDLYGRKPSGKEVRLLRGAIENLAGALITLGGFNAHTGEVKPKLASLVHLVESAVWGEDLEVAVPTRADARHTGRLRRDSYELRLALWLVRQLEHKYVTWLDWRLQRRLSGLAKRLWIYLEAERYKPTSHGREQAYIVLGEKAYTALGVNHARERARRTALARAGERVVEADPHYAAVAVEAHPFMAGKWRILATRIRDPEARAVAAEARRSLAQAEAAGADRGAGWAPTGQGQLLGA